MNNPLKNNSLASGLLGFILGAAAIWGGSQFSNLDEGNRGVASSLTGFLPRVGEETLSDEDDEQDVSDDMVVVTPSGRCYHNVFSGCSTLRKSKRVKRVSRERAVSKGRIPCSKCNP